MSIAGKEKKKIRKWMEDSEAVFRLIYQGSIDGFNGKAFHQKCDNQGPTVTVAFHDNGAVFGGYASQSWNSLNNYISDSEAFLFHLRNNGGAEMMRKYPLVSQPDSFTEGENNALYGHPQYGPTFGSGHDLCLWKDGEYNLQTNEYVLTNGSSKRVTYEGHRLDLLDSAFQLKEVLVYKITGKDCSDDGEDEIPQWIRDKVKPWRKNKILWTKKFRQELLEDVESYKPPNNLKHVRFVLFGLQSAGKSSFFNTINSAFKGRITKRTLMGSDTRSLTSEYRAFPLKSSSENIELKFKICDTMGFSDDSGLRMSDAIYLLEGRLPDGYDFTSSENYKTFCALKWFPTPADMIHGIGLVIDASTVDVMHASCIDQYKTIIREGHKRGIPTVVLMTKIDLVCEQTMDDLSYVFYSQEVKDKVDTLAEKLGVTKNSVIPVKNYESENDLETSCDILALNAIKQLQNFCDDYIEEYGTGDPESENSLLNISTGILGVLVLFLATIWAIANR